jgi:LuxR family transcriptional regulator, maltose regulon positive regulatory protein
MVAPLSTAAAAGQVTAAATVGRTRNTRGARRRPQARQSDEDTAEAGLPLLATKLTPPRPPFRVVSRPRLFALLDAGARQLLTLVSAPAGAGKTTLLASWSAAGQPPGPVAWLSLDPGDNQPTRFWAYALAVLRRSGAVPANSALRSLAPRPGSDEAFLPLLVSGLAELPTPLVLVLDDVQEITDATVLNGLEFLLRHAPPQLRLVVATRVDPPLPLQRLLVSGRLTQVRSADLAFTVAEVADLLAEYEYHPRLSEDDLAMLHARTEGWAAGLRLAALSLQGQPDPRRFVTEFAGDDRSIADYLVGEVLDRQPEELRSFLLRTCIVEELNGDLADALTGRHDGEWTLARLERANTFVAAVGSRRSTYRYHQLFATLLRYELRRESPDQVAELHRRAARWYAARGLTVDAIQQALMVQDWRAAADLLAEHGLRLILRDEAATLHELVGRLPADLVQADPELALLGAADRVVSEDPETATAYLRLAQQRQELLHQDRRGRFALRLASWRAALAWQVGDLDEVLVAGHQALALQAQAGADGVDDDGRAVTLSTLGTAELWAGDLDAAEIHLREGQAVALRAGLGCLQLTCTSQLAVLHAMWGALGQAFRLGSDAVELAARCGWSSSVQAAGGHLALAWVQYYRDDLIEASRHLEQATAASRAFPEQPVTLAVAILRAQLQRARGDLAGSLATVASARRDATGWTPPAQLWRWLVLTEAQLRSAAGQAQPARALLEDLEESSLLRAGEAVALARLQLAEGDPAGAAQTVSSCLDGTAPSGFLMVPAEAWLLDALASDALADRDRAAASLQRALTLAEQGGFRRSFLDAGAPARSLLARYRHRMPACWSYLDELLQASTESTRAATSLSALIEQLTERERAVLRYLPSLMTYEEIASDLYVSVNTVKSHVHGIFRKLGVSGRRQAVRSARELRLL